MILITISVRFAPSTWESCVVSRSEWVVVSSLQVEGLVLSLS